ncbi:MAG: hypothetical protein ACFFB5_24790 [Promethearchaeota archaeon]
MPENEEKNWMDRIKQELKALNKSIKPIETKKNYRNIKGRRIDSILRNH